MHFSRLHCLEPISIWAHVTFRRNFRRSPGYISIALRDNSYDPVSLSYSFDQERVSVKHVEICDAIAFDRHKCEFQVLPGMSELDNQLTQSFWSVGHMLRGTCDAEVGEEILARR